VILVCGIPTESPVARVVDALSDQQADFAVLNQRHFDDVELAYEVGAGGRVDGLLRIGRRHWPLGEIDAVYIRVMDDRDLPELKDEPPDSARRREARALHDALISWTDIAPIRVLNRSAPMASNGSKPYQAQIIARHGFAVPETLITNDPDEARAFYAAHPRVVFKSISGMRSIVQTMTDADLARLDAIRWCPVQFQAYVPGTDVRVHTVGEAVFATRIRSDATDYRYAREQTDNLAELEPTDLDDDVAARCVALGADLGLEFAGIDLKLADAADRAADVFCFEVNPSPAYSYFEAHTGQPIAAAVARHLAAAR
jgi:hypothetical protein